MKYDRKALIFLNESSDTEEIATMLDSMINADGGATLREVTRKNSLNFPETYGDSSCCFLGNLACLFLDDVSTMELLMQDVEQSFIQMVTFSTMGVINVYYTGNVCEEFFNSLATESSKISNIELEDMKVSYPEDECLEELEDLIYKDVNDDYEEDYF